MAAASDRGNAKGPPVHNRVAVLRAERGWSRRELADRLGVHYQTVGYIERGEYHPSLALALEMSRVFEVPVEGIFSLDPLPPLSAEVFPRRTA